MKILQVIDKLNSGGAERICIELSNLLYEANVEISLLHFLDGGDLIFLLNKKIHIEKFTRVSKFDIESAFKLAEILKKYDLIHVHMRHNFRYVQLVANLFNIKTDIVLHDHSSQIEGVPLFLNNLLRPKNYIGVCNETTNWAKKKLKVRENSIYLLGNVITKKKIDNSCIDRNGFVCVGNIKPNKNQLFAIQLLAYLDEDLTIYGKVQDLAYFNLLKEEIEKLKLQNRVFFVHNELNVQSKLKNFKLALQTSILESGPLVLIEFLAQSLPFVAYKTGEVSAVLETEIPNLFLDSFDQKKWLKKIKFVLKESYNLEELYYKHFNPKNYLDQCLQIYLNIKNS